MHRKQTFFRSLVLSGGLLAASAVGAYAQSPTGAIAGTVQDASGATVPNATVTITNTGTNDIKTVKTDDAGRYSQGLLNPGTYQVKILAPGFAPQEQDGVTVDVQQTHPVDFSLAVGSDTAQVTVQSTTPELQTQSATTEQVITGKRILDLPLNGRNPYDLAVLVPGVNNVGTGAGSSSTPHIAGSRNANSEVQLDGVSTILPENNVGNGFESYQPVVDDVQEFNVQTTVLPAEYGRFSGGVINVATRTGTNAFHGDLFEFNRDSLFTARDYFASANSPVSPSQRNQAGASVGGPIIKDRTFFFGGFQISKETDSETETDSVATPLMRQGNFSELLSQATPVQIYDPRSSHAGTYTSGGQQVNGFIRNPYAGNIIPQGQLSPAGQAALSFQPLPNVPGAGIFNNYVVTGAQTNNNWQIDSRVDHRWNQNWQTFVRFSHLQSTYIPFADYPINAAGQATGGIASLGYNGPSVGSEYNFAYDNVFTLSPTLIFDIRYGFNRSTTVRTPLGGPFNVTGVGLPAALNSTNYQAFPNFNLSNGFSSFGSQGFVPLLQNPSSHILVANFSKTKGAHQLQFGGEYRKLFLNFHQYGYPQGQFNFSQSFTQLAVNDTAGGGGNPFASLLLGTGDGGQYTIDPSFATAGAYYALYAEDTWRVTNHFTVSYGLRWDADQPRTERHNQLSYFNPNDVSPINNLVPANAAYPALGNLRGAEHFVGSSTGQFGRQQIGLHKLDFGPRIGLIYSPDPNWSVRAGYAIVYASSVVQPAGTSGGAGTDGYSTNTGPLFSLDSERTVNTTLDNPYPTGFQLPAGAAGGLGNNLGAGVTQDYLVNGNTRTPYSEQANLTVQRSLPGQTIIEVGWLLNLGKFLVQGDPGVPHDQVNPSYLSLGQGLLDLVPNPFYGIITTPGSTLAQPMVQRNQLLRPFPQYTQVNEYRKDTAFSNYNALTVRVDKRFTSGLTLLLSYTAGKLFDNSASAVTFLGPVSQTYANQYNPNGEYALSPQDLSRDLVTSYTYELPFGPGRHFLGNSHGIAGKLLGGFQTSGIVSWLGGTPLTFASVGDNTGLFTLGQRPTQSAPNAKLANPTRSRYFNTSLFSAPAPFTFGNARRTLDNVRTPQLVNADLSAIKNNYFGADNRYNLQLRLEGFNALNHVQLNGPDTGVNDGSNFGLINSTATGYSSRQVQLAAKFSF